MRFYAIVEEQAQKKLKAEDELFPQIWNMSLDEESVFSFLAYVVPLEDVLVKLLRKFASQDKSENLKVSWRYLFYTQSMFPGYYSDRERTVVLFNRFKGQDRNWEQLFYWISFLSEKNKHPYTHLLISVMFLDHYLRHLHQEIWLDQALKHLHEVEREFKQETSQRSVEAMLAFGYYLKRDFNRSLNYINRNKNEEFEQDFQGLIRKVA